MSGGCSSEPPADRRSDEHPQACPDYAQSRAERTPPRAGEIASDGATCFEGKALTHTARLILGTARQEMRTRLQEERAVGGALRATSALSWTG